MRVRLPFFVSFILQLKETVYKFAQNELAPFAQDIDQNNGWDGLRVRSEIRCVCVRVCACVACVACVVCVRFSLCACPPLYPLLAFGCWFIFSHTHTHTRTHTRTK